MWRVVGASVPGAYHKKKNILCQDALLHRVLASDTVILTVADGAGSAECSREGAKLAVRQATSTVVKLIQGKRLPQNESGWRRVMEEVFQDVIQALENAAMTKGKQLPAYSTTLTCVVATAEGLAVGQIGDGMVVAESAEGNLALVMRPQRGEYANQSTFVTMPRGLEMLKVAVSWELVSAVVVATDGLLRLALQLPEYQPYIQFFKPLLSFVAGTETEKEAKHQLLTFLNSERVCARTDDDRTLLLAVHMPSYTKQVTGSSAKKLMESGGR